MGWLLLVVLAMLAAAPWAIERARTPADNSAGAKTHHRWRGPEDGPVAVCVHGLTTPSLIYDPLAQRLAEAGYRTLAYDLPGRGRSAPQPGAQDGAFFLRQLESLLTAEGIGKIDLLIGYSMGGCIVTRFAARFPERVGRLVLLAPAGLLHNAGPLAEFLRRTPVIGDGLMLAFGGLVMRRDLAKLPPSPLRDLQMAQTGQRGFLPAVLSSQRHILSEDMRPHHRSIAAAGVPTLAIWGIEDSVIPVSNVGRLAEVNRIAHQATVPGATHALPNSHPDQVMEEIREFLNDTTTDRTS
ncbi:alpha/beta fold hydrolase [Oceaniglobus trochenteri]|uniref:alpha/beta fold hydrolase n=1 Tax=Oceaniglobus trochenteri TaxID=2763260 RepID=UPI001CFFE3ED|nr:alpha/beta hydrolase [Oceaniglobus trochenteri]